MRISYYSCVFMVALFFASCAAKHVSFIKKQEIVYQTGFPVRDIYGVFYNTEDKTEYFYIADMGEYKKLLFFTTDGEKKIEIPTDSVTSWRTSRGIVIKNLDTIVFVQSGNPSMGSDRIVFMDRNGNRWKKIELNSAIQADESNWNYWFYTRSNNSFWEQNVFFLKTGLVHKTVDSSILKTKNQELILKDIVPKTHKSHVLLKYNIENGQYQYALSNMWRIICPDTNLYLLSIDFTLENNILFVYSSYSGNVLYLLDKNTFQTKKKIEITSSYTDIGVPPCPLEDRIGMYYEENVPLHGWLSKIMYDKYNHFYYVVIRHGVEDPLLQDEALFSIQVYDKKFNKLSEQVFDGKEYNHTDCLVCSKGLLIRHSSSRRDYSPTEVKYDLFEIKK